MTITFMGFHMPLDGYGYATIQIARELQKLDRAAQIVDMRDDGEFGTIGEREWHSEGTVVALCTPDSLPYIHADRLISYTMFEATKLPEGWAELINTHAQVCLVPCTWCAEVFRANGVNVPIEVVKWGINPEDYWPLEREVALAATEKIKSVWPYTFLWSGTADRRKGWDVAYRAFDRAFRNDASVQLHLHFRDLLPMNPRFGDPNVRVTIGRFERPMLRDMLAAADCFVFPSRGEGWGSPPREAAATGLPVIATDYGGLHEEIEHWAMPLRWQGFSPAAYGWWDDIGEWPEPSIDHLVELMMWCVEHPMEAMIGGAQAAEWLRANATWKRTARGILAAIMGTPEKIGLRIS